jgi:hypothetical protein
VVEPLGLILGEGEDLASPVCELVESIHGRVASVVPVPSNDQDLLLSVRHHLGSPPSIGTTSYGSRTLIRYYVVWQQDAHRIAAVAREDSY